MFAHIQQLYLSFRSNGILNRNICAMEVRLLQLFQNINYIALFRKHISFVRTDIRANEVNINTND